MGKSGRIAEQAQKKRNSGQAQKRFTIGTKILCRTGAEDWSAGEVVKLDYREPDWPAGMIVPYQVRLEDGRLIYAPADIDQVCRELVHPWWHAAFQKPSSFFAKNNPDAHCLIKEGIDEDVSEPNHKGSTALMEAVKKKWPNAVETLIRMKADVNMADSTKTRAIHMAVAHGIGIIKLLVDAKAELNCQDRDPDHDPEFTSTTFGDRLEHRTPLHYLCMKGDVEAAGLLVKAGAKTNIQDAQMKTPLHLAIEEEQNDCIELLLNSNADLEVGNQSSGMDNGPLMGAAFKGNTELVKMLIAAKADIHKQGKQQMSALHLAARSRRVEAAQALLAARADMNQESNCGTPLQLARKNGGVNLLKAFGVEPDTPSDVTGDCKSTS